MAKHHRNHRHLFKKTNHCSNRSILIGLASLIWFIFRTGTKPSRVIYPCQRAALANSSILFGLSALLLLASKWTKTKKFVSKNGVNLLILLLIASVALSSSEFLGRTNLVEAAIPNQELYLSLEASQASSSLASDLYVINGREIANVNELINLMGSNGLPFYQSNATKANQGPSGLVAKNDVILIKINEEWPYRGGTNTDILKQLIQALVDHPEGFIGEIVVADNGQWQGSMDWSQSNAEDHAQSTQDVVNMFSDFKVSTYTWIPIRSTRVNEYSEGDLKEGYILYDNPDPETGIYVSYPKFKTKFGTYISFKKGIWNGTDYEKRLKIINMPVLKTHSSYGVTASLKHYMGVQSQGEGQPGLANGHSKVATGGMGTLMVETGFPTLNIIDAIWVNANPPPFSGAGPSTPYDQASRVNVLMASTDPVALDYWAAKHVLMQTANLIGHTDLHTINPDNTDDRSGVSGEAFGVWLRRTESEIAAGGYQVTSKENEINVFVKSEAPSITPTPSPTPQPTATPNPTATPSQPPSSPSPTSSPTASPNPTPSPPTKPEDSQLTIYIIAGIIGAVAVFALMMLKKR